MPDPKKALANQPNQAEQDAKDAQQLKDAKAAKELAKKLPKKVVQGLEFWSNGQLHEALKNLQPFLESATEEDLANVQQLLQLHKVKESLPEIVAIARVQLVAEGAKKLRKPGPKELAASLPILYERAQTLRTRVIEELAIGFHIQVPHEVIDQRLESLPGHFTHLEQADLLLAHCQELTKNLDDDARAALPEATRKLLEIDLTAERAKRNELEIKTVERIVEMCQVRASDMLAVLNDEKTDYKVRFRAVRRLGESFGLLRKFWTRYTESPAFAERLAAKGTKGKRPTASQLKARWIDQERAFQRLSGELRLKAYHFEQAKLWWLRGRFGKGPLENGILKIASADTRTGQQNLLFYPLMMPYPIPKVPDPTKSLAQIPLSRRHSFWWRQELDVNYYSTPTKDFSPEAIDSDLQVGFLPNTKPEIPPLDTTPECMGLVGYLEYQMALYHFEKLVKHSRQAEIEALDDMIADDYRFAIPSYLSRVYDDLEPLSTLRLEPPQVIHPRATHAFERRGLAWVMALARLEIQAMRVAIYRTLARAPYVGVEDIQVRDDLGTRQPSRGKRRVLANSVNYESVRGPSRRVNSGVEPFDAFPATAFERDAYTELFVDAYRDHYYALRTQFAFVAAEPMPRGRAVAGFVGIPVFSPAQMLRIQRIWLRALLALEMGAELFQKETLTPTQQQEVFIWNQWLASLVTAMELNLRPEIRSRITLFRGEDIQSARNRMQQQQIDPNAQNRVLEKAGITNPRNNPQNKVRPNTSNRPNPGLPPNVQPGNNVPRPNPPTNNLIENDRPAPPMNTPRPKPKG